MSMAAQVIQETRNHITQLAFTRLVRALGQGTGTLVGDEVLMRMGARDLVSQQDVLVFANHLIARGGIVESVGRALKVSALLRGATE